MSAIDRRDPTLKKFTHKWMVYVSEPPSTTGENTNFITCVRFHIHPSYKPHDVVDVTEPPFKLTRLGWGEFPIRIQLFFVDKKRNKSIDIIHHLKVTRKGTRKQLTILI
jgi:transcription initiation factor IIF auxiliary subunit